MTYYVAFGLSSERNWWDIANKIGFEHCYAWHALGDGNAVGVEFNKHGLEVTYRECSAQQLLGEVLDRYDCTCVVEVEQKWVRRPYAPRGIINCVSATKAFLGLHGFTSLTPYALCRRLLAHGGRLYHGRHV